MPGLSSKDYIHNFRGDRILETDELYRIPEEQIFELALGYIKQMFPRFKKSRVNHYHVWKARYAQPVVECNYSQLIPSTETPIKGLYIATMAQIYPEDRGINYAIREGKRIGQMMAKQIAGKKNKREILMPFGINKM